ncbi:ComEA family DNA-binding protein [Lachnospiraceae bacterium 47-T17]
MKQKQRKAAKAAFGCLVLLLLYGCASGFHGGASDIGSPAAAAGEAGISWTEDGAGEEPNQGWKEVPDAAGEAPAKGTQDEPLPGNAGGDEGAGEMPGQIAVYVCGAVKHPGVYELVAGSRVYEAVALAGGMTKEASDYGVNQAEVLSDGQMVVILTEEEIRAGENGAVEASDADELVNINTAGAGELKTLPGIGDAKAAAIIAYREQHGPFAAVSDIKRVSGIGEGVFARLEGLIKVD